MKALKFPQIIFIDRNVLLLDGWMVDQLGSAVASQLSVHEGLSAFVRQTGERRGDFSVIWFKYKPEPAATQIIGIPGRGKSPIVQTVFEKE